VCALVALNPSSTEAGYDWVGWLEQLSGPGPLGGEGLFPGLAATLCRTDDRDVGAAVMEGPGRLASGAVRGLKGILPGKAVTGGPPKNDGANQLDGDPSGFTRPDDRMKIRVRKWVLGTPANERSIACLYLETQRFKRPTPDTADPNRTFDSRGFPLRLNARLVEVGVNYPIAPVFEVGAGVGRMRFSVKESGGDSTLTTKWTFTPVRMTFLPLNLAPSLRKFKAASALKFVFKETYIIGDVTGADFRALAGSEAEGYVSRGDLVRALTAELDLSALPCASSRVQASKRWRWTRALGDCGAPPDDRLTVFVRELDGTPINGANVCVLPHAAQGHYGTTTDGRLVVPQDHRDDKGTPKSNNTEPITIVMPDGTPIVAERAEKPGLNDVVVVVSMSGRQTRTVLVNRETTRIDVRLRSDSNGTVVTCDPPAAARPAAQ